MHLVSFKDKRRRLKIKKIFRGSLFKVVIFASVHVAKEIGRDWQAASIQTWNRWQETKREIWPTWIREKVLVRIAERNILGEARANIAYLIFLNLAVLGIINQQGMFHVGLQYNYAEGETMEEIMNPDPIDANELQALTKFDPKKEKNDESEKEENRSLVLRLNEIIASQNEKCQANARKGQCTKLCVKNEEEVIARMKKEEREAWQKYVSSRPKIKMNERKISCPEDTKGAKKSDNKGKHMDEDCCPDPDEWPKPGCVYSAKGLALMLSGPPKGKK